MTGAAISFGCAAPVRLDVVVHPTPSPKDVYRHEHTENRHHCNIQHHNLLNELTIRVKRRVLEQPAVDRNDCGANTHDVDRREDTQHQGEHQLYSDLCRSLFGALAAFRP